MSDTHDLSFCSMVYLNAPIRHRAFNFLLFSAGKLLIVTDRKLAVAQTQDKQLKCLKRKGPGSSVLKFHEFVA